METNLYPLSLSSSTSSEDVAATIGSDNQKIVEWEDLQQELARLCSLSSALNKAKEKKESLAQKLQGIIKVRDEYVHQSNELEDMREELEARKLIHGDMSIYIKKMLEDVKNHREQLCVDIRMLLAAGKTLSAACQQLQEANKLLAGKRGHENLKSLRKMLRRRQQYMITQVSTLYPVKAINEYKERSNSQHDGIKSRDSASSSVPTTSKPQQIPPLTILGLQLTAIPHKKMGFFSNKVEIQRSATVLGYIAQDLEQLLNSNGAESLGPRHVLANLKELLRIIQSGEYIDD